MPGRVHTIFVSNRLSDSDTCLLVGVVQTNCSCDIDTKPATVSITAPLFQQYCFQIQFAYRAAIFAQRSGCELPERSLISFGILADIFARATQGLLIERLYEPERKRKRKKIEKLSSHWLVRGNCQMFGRRVREI